MSNNIQVVDGTNTLRTMQATDYGGVLRWVHDVATLPSDPLGSSSDVATTGDSAGTLSAKLRGLTKWAFSAMPAALGSALSAASLPVVMASDWVCNQLPTSLGQKLKAASMSVTIASDQPALPTVPAIQTSGGYSTSRTTSLLAAGVMIKNTPGQVFGWVLNNTNATDVRYVKLWDRVTSPTIGTDTPLLTIPVPAGAFYGVQEFANGIQFLNGIWVAATTGVLDSDVTAPAANEVLAQIFYK